MTIMKTQNNFTHINTPTKKRHTQIHSNTYTTKTYEHKKTRKKERNPKSYTENTHRIII